MAPTHREGTVPRSLVLLSLLIASSASAVSMAWTPIGNPGNAPTRSAGSCISANCGEVDYNYSISTYDVTNAQYAEFLNAVAASDPYSLFNSTMASDARNGGITESGVPGSYTYSVKAGFANKPVIYVSFYDALRFANWMNNGQGSGGTETGSYTLLGGTPTPSNGDTVTRNPGATIVLPSENEWYKAAYYDGVSAAYHQYPFADGFNGVVCEGPAGTTNHSANCNQSFGYVTPVGAYTNSPSSYGTFDQGGNVAQWNEQFVHTTSSGNGRGERGGSWYISEYFMESSTFGFGDPTFENYNVGFRVAMVPEPNTGLLVLAGLLGLAGWRRVHARPSQ
jgi:formylglycine-generating enzyme